MDGHKEDRTRHELLDADRVQVTDWIKTPEGWRRAVEPTCRGTRQTTVWSDVPVRA